MTIPAPIVKQLSLTEGTLFDCRVEAQRIILEIIWQEAQAESAKVVLSESPKKFTLNCFGRFFLLRDGAPMDLPRRKVREALAYLACAEGLPVGKQTVAAALWPGQGEGQAMDSLYKVCRALRALEARGDIPPVRIGRGTLWLDMEATACDLLSFQRWTSAQASMDELRRAVELYRAPLLVEEGYEWTEPLEGYFDMRYLDALERLAACYRKLGQRNKAAYYEGLMEA